MHLLSEASVDKIHRPTREVGFTESLGFRFVQPGETLGFLARLNLRPNQQTMDVGLDIFLADGGLLGARHVGRLSPGKTELEVEGVSFTQEGASWHIVYDGGAHALASCRNAGDHEFWHKSRLERVIVDLEFEAEDKPVSTDLHPDAFAQTVQVRGEIWVSGDQYEIDVAGLRDRSWGTQDSQIPKARRRIEARFEGGGALSLERRWAEDGPHLTGWIKVEDEIREIVSGRIETEPEADFPYPKALALSLVDSSRKRHRIEVEMLHTAPLAGSANQVKYLSCQSVSVFSWGDLRGHGIVEYLHRLDENGAPIIPTDV
ncbi:MAG: hypothetical protein VCC00_15410 [Deltaproteobacteria bacterium]